MTTTNQLFDLRGKRAIVTGGATGLGLQVADALAEAGADLMICARTADRCEQAATLLAERHGVTAVARGCDVRSAEETAAVVEAAVAQLGGVDILINNAGTSWGAPAVDFPLHGWQKVVDVNLTGTFLFSQAAARQMIDQGTGGKIVNLASVLGMRGAPAEVVDAVAYSASKGGVIALTKDLAVKWAPHRIGVNAIAPGWFPTDMSEDVISRDRERFLARIPAGRLGSEDDLKGVAVFLSSPASDYVFGQTIAVDGGMSVS